MIIVEAAAGFGKTSVSYVAESNVKIGIINHLKRKNGSPICKKAAKRRPWNNEARALCAEGSPLPPENIQKPTEYI